MKKDKTILVVEDEQGARQVLRLILESKGYRVLEAENGQIALEIFEANCPDLVIMDVQMPIVTGFEACRRIRTELDDTSTYVIALTARKEIEEKVTGLDLGVDAYFTKPYNPEELLAQIRVGLKTTETRRNSLIDSLTDLPNRAAFYANLNREIARSKRYSNRLSLAFIDLDKFKPINDKEGHQVGDLVLRELAQCVGKRIRESDFFARIGGDEFVIYLPSTTADGAKAMIKPICTAIKNHPFSKIGQGRISISVGISELRGDDEMEKFLKRADDAVYQAKKKGGNQIVLF